MERSIITISREYGSGGRRIGELLAEMVGVPFYDRDIIKLSAENLGMSTEVIEETDESIPSTFLHNLTYSAYSVFDYVALYDIPVTDKVFLAQSEVIKELALKGSCIIVGRCADYVLCDDPDLVKVFIRAEVEDRIKLATNEYDLPTDKAVESIKKIDKSRKNYYRHYTNRQWGNVANYDIVLNSSFTGIEGAVAVIRTLLDTKKV